MKHIFLPALLLLFILGCSKFEGEYAIFCRFPPDFSKIRYLVVTGREGNFIGKFTIPVRASSIEEILKPTDTDVADHYDLHLIDSTAYFTTIYSHLEVPNGAPVFLNPEGTNQKTYNLINVIISDIETFDSLYWTKTNSISGYVYKAAEKRIYADIYVEFGQEYILSLLANGQTDVRHLYLSNAELSSNTAINVSWQDFIKAQSKTFSIEVLDTNPVLFWEVKAVSPDLTRFVGLHQSDLLSNQPQQGALEFNQPEVLEYPSAFAIKVGTSNSHYEKIFQPGEPLRFQVSDMSFRETSLTGKTVNIETEGDVDLLRLEFFNFQQVPHHVTRWEVSGTPASFKNRTLPDLDSWLPAGLNKTAFFNSATAIACQFGGHNYPQIREGFPWKSTEPFAIARSGYRAVRKDF